MTLYNATGSGVIQTGTNVLIQVYGSDVLGRMRIHSWDLSFQGIVAGNVMDVSLVASDNFGFPTRFTRASVLDGEAKLSDASPNVAHDFTVDPTVEDVLDSISVVDSAFLRKQYAKGCEPVIGTSSGVDVRCTPSDLFTPVPYKVNITFSL